MNSEQIFEVQKNRKAFTYTLIICGVILLLFIIISWKVQPPTPPVVQDLIEINLGNDEDGFGEIQPLIKGERSPAEETVTAEQAASLASAAFSAAIAAFTFAFRRDFLRAAAFLWITPFLAALSMMLTAARKASSLFSELAAATAFLIAP